VSTESTENKFRKLILRLENCRDAWKRDALMDDLIALTPDCHFSREEWFELDGRLDMIAKGLLGDSSAFGVVN